MGEEGRSQPHQRSRLRTSKHVADGGGGGVGESGRKEREGAEEKAVLDSTVTHRQALEQRGEEKKRGRWGGQ